MNLFDDGGAAVSECGRYRYCLWRRTGLRGLKRLVFVGLNPSTADAERDDPTIRRMRGFAEREDAAMLVVVNLFAWRATHPRDLFTARNAGHDIIGPENDQHLRDALWHHDAVPVVAWGAIPAQYGPRTRDVRRLAPPVLMCLGTSKLGAPRHPLYLRRDAELARWSCGSLAPDEEKR